MRAGVLVMSVVMTGRALAGGDWAPASGAINALGCDLLAVTRPGGGNALISPFSIQTALAMTYAGASGATRDEMARVLRFGGDEDALHASFAALRTDLDAIAKATEERAKQSERRGGPRDPVIVTVANRLFGQAGYQFRAPFLDFVRDTYGAPLQELDFRANARRETRVINRWVEDQTRDRIRNLIPEDALNEETRLVLVNAIYLKAPWEEAFNEAATKPRPFRIGGVQDADVATMTRKMSVGFRRTDGYSALTIPYSGGGLQLLVLFPDDPAGLAALEGSITPGLLSAAADAPRMDAIVFLPKFKIEPPLMALGAELRKLGMTTAFNVPFGSADFDRMAPRRPDDYLYISEVFHKTFLDLDEKGTEAAAATAVVMMRATAMPGPTPEPLEIRVDRPFLFAIQHRASGACLFLGRVSDPR